MDQKNIVVGLLLFVIVSFGGLIFYDVKVGHKFERFLGKEIVAKNWKWEDNWDGKGPVTQPDKIHTPPVDAPGPQLIAGSYTEAVQKSGEVGKPVLVFFTAEWCQWCKKMKTETMTDSKVQSVCKNYILVYVDTDKDRAPATKFGVENLPAYVITNAKEAKLKMEAGFKNADSFSSWLNDTSLFQQPKTEQPQVKPPTQPNKQQPPQRQRRRREQPPQPQNPNMRPGQPPPMTQPPPMQRVQPPCQPGNG